MKNIAILIFFLSVLIAHTETPKNTCIIDYPFRKDDFSCDNFEKICVKTDDDVCKNFLSACKQCPPTNYTVIMYQDLLKIKDEILIAKNEILNLTVIFNKTNLNKEAKLNKILKSGDLIRNVSVTIIILLFLILILLILEIRFKLISKFFRTITKEKYKRVNQDEIERQNSQQCSPIILDEMKRLIENLKVSSSYLPVDESEFVKRYYDQMKETNQNLKDELKQTIRNVSAGSRRLKFRVGKEMIELEVQVHENDNAVKLRRQFADRIAGGSPNDCKAMTMKYKGIQLDNNKYLLPCIDSPEIPIYCKYDANNININEIIVLNLMANFPVPEMVEMNLWQTVGQLKATISDITGLRKEDLIIVKASKELDNEETVDKCGFTDCDSVQVIYKTWQTVSVQSLFRDKMQHKFKCSSTETLSELKAKLAEELKCDIKNLSLFMGGEYLQPNDYLYKYNIGADKSIKYVNFAQKPDLYEIEPIVNSDYNSRYSKGKVKSSKEEVMIKSYNIKTEGMNTNPTEWLIKRLRLSLLTVSHSRFIQLLDAFHDESHVILVMENVHGSTLNSFIENEKNYPLMEYEISKWTKQILEGLEYIHQFGIIYMDLSPFHIFLDDNHNVKLTNFNQTDYLGIENIENFEEFAENNEIKYVSPEIIRKEEYGVKADVWSLGAILVKIHTRETLCSRLSDREMVDMMLHNKNIKYNDKGMSKELKEFIDQCLIGDVNVRASTNHLFNTEFIRKYQ